jgi:hypothetical protein
MHKLIRPISLAGVCLLACCATQDQVSDSDIDSTRLTEALDLKPPPLIALAPIPSYEPPAFRHLGGGLVLMEVERDPNIPMINLLLRIDGTIDVEGSRYTDADALHAKMIEIKDRMPTPDFDLQYEGRSSPADSIEKWIPALRLLTDSCLPPSAQRSICLSGPVK